MIFVRFWRKRMVRWTVKSSGYMLLPVCKDLELTRLESQTCPNGSRQLSNPITCTIYRLHPGLHVTEILSMDDNPYEAQQYPKLYHPAKRSLLHEYDPTNCIFHRYIVEGKLCFLPKYIYIEPSVQTLFGEHIYKECFCNTNVW